MAGRHEGLVGGPHVLLIVVRREASTHLVLVGLLEGVHLVAGLALVDAPVGRVATTAAERRVHGTALRPLLALVAVH